MKILFSAYASEPGAGSEYGVGWMVPVTMARRYPDIQIYVLTRSRCREKIEKALAELELPNLHFLFYDIPKWMFYKKEMKSHWGEQINYLLWQMMARRFVKKQLKSYGFDVFHHLTFNQYRTPSPGFWLDIPFVMGPIGGAEQIAPCFWQDLEPHSQKKEQIRQKGKDLSLFRWLMSRGKNKKLILCSCQENKDRLEPFSKGSKLMVLPAIAYDIQDFPFKVNEKKADKPFSMIYAGKALDWKGLLIFLRSLKLAFLDNEIKDFEVKLIGIRFEDEQRKVLGWVQELGLTTQVSLIPFVQRKNLLEMMARDCSLSVYPAFRDSGSMSVLEASALGLATICFNTGGQDIFPDDILLKVPVGDSYEESLSKFADKLLWAYRNPDQLCAIGERSQGWVSENLTWDKKVDAFVNIYKEILE